LVMCHVSHLYASGASLYFIFLARQEEGAELDQWAAAKSAAADSTVAARPPPVDAGRGRAARPGRGARGQAGAGSRGHHEPGEADTRVWPRRGLTASTELQVALQDD